MKIQDLIAAHFQWRKNLISSIEEGISADMITDVLRDDLCDIGRWFHGEGMTLFSHVPEFAVAKTAHSRFHQMAGHSLNEKGEMGGDHEFHMMIEAFHALNNKIGHLD